MGPLPPFQVTVDSKGWSCVPDLRLLLARHGPMLALRLADELRVCLVPRLWYVLDNTEHYQRHPEALLSDPFSDARDQAPDPQALVQWEWARLELGLPLLKLYWAGDALHESFLPKEVDAEVVERFERFGRALEERLLAADPELEPALPLIGGALDTAALAAAMSRYRPLILTLVDGEDGPPLGRLLDLCAVPCRRVAEEQTQALRAQLLPQLARCGALELCWAGLRLAAVHLVAPRAFFPPPGAEHETALDAVPTDREDVWQDASAFWYPLP